MSPQMSLPLPSTVTDMAMHTQSTSSVMPTPMTATDLPMRTQPIAEGLVPTSGDTAQEYHIRLHRKRQERSSPCSFPHNLTRSPCPNDINELQHSVKPEI